MTSYKTSLSKRHITMHSDNVHHIEFKISKNTVMHVSTCEIVFVKYMKAPNNEIKYCTLRNIHNVDLVDFTVYIVTAVG